MLMTLETMQGFELVEMTGPLDAEAVIEIKDSLEALTQRVSKGVVLDMSGVTFLDSSGVGALVFMFKRLAAGQRTLHLVGLNNQPLRLVQLLRINRTIQTHSSIEDFNALSLVTTG
jgi:anti-anti-sigma factor